jgi:hypothetical protein
MFCCYPDYLPDDVRLEAINAGAKVSGTVTETINILVCGSSAGVKKPEKKGVEVWTEEQFTSALSGDGSSSSSQKQGAAGGSSSSSAPEAKKGETADAQHPIDASDVLQAVKDGSFTTFETLLESQKKLSFEDFNSLPPDRNFGVIHQLATHGNRASLQAKIFYPDICDFGFLECSGLDSLGTASKQPTCRTPQTLQLENMPT